MNKYWASEDAEYVAGHLSTKLSEWRMLAKNTGLQQMWAKCYRYYYGKHFKNDFVTNTLGIKNVGEEGELKAVTINHYRNVLRHILNITTKDKPAWDPRATNTEQKSIQQTKLAANILDYYMRDKRMGRYFRDSAELALVMGKGFVKVEWDPTLGKPYTTEPVTDKEGNPQFEEDGQPKMKTINEGDVKIKAYPPTDVFNDQSVQDWDQVDWILTRDDENKYDLAALHPDLAEKLTALTGSQAQGMGYNLSFQVIEESVYVPVYTFTHKKTPAMPNGRLLKFCDQGIILYDGPIPYNRLNVFRIVPGKIYGTTEGYSDGFDIIDPQEAIDVLYSTAFTNQQAFGTQFLWIPDGCNMSSTQFKGLAVLKGGVPGTEPKALQLCATPAELFQNIQMLEKVIEVLSGVNSVVRGDPESSLKSGVALSIVTAQAAQYMSGFQESWAELSEDVGTFLLHLIKDFAKTKRTIAVAGKDNRTLMQSFSGQDLSDIDRVVVDLGNPYAKTIGGKAEIAKDLLQSGMIQTPTEYINVLKTGQLEPATKGYESQIDLVHRENEDLMDGKMCIALATDRHIIHMQEHLTILNDPELRRSADAKDPNAQAVIQVVTDHYMQHKQLYQTGDPLNSMITGDPPPPPPPMPPPGMQIPPPPGNGPPQGPPPPEAGPNVSHVVHHQAPPGAPPPGMQNG